MEYLTFDEYNTMHLSTLDKDKFDNLYFRAKDLVNIVTRNHYQFHDLDSDIDFRKNAFKRAIGLQIEYQFRTGILTAEDKKSAENIKSQSIGRTSLSMGGGNSGNGNLSTATNLLADDSIQLLLSIGLLYVGGIGLC